MNDSVKRALTCVGFCILLVAIIISSVMLADVIGRVFCVGVM